MTEHSRASTPLLSVHEVEFSYGRLQVLFGVSLDVHPAEAVALLGTNGAGKSTLLRVIAGLQHASAGHVVFDNTDITTKAAERLPAHGLVLVPGGNAIFPDMTVSENLEMQSIPMRRDRTALQARQRHVLDVFPRLGQRRSQPAGTLSGGEQQQLALAKALLLNPKLLCIDELSLGLAPIVVQELLGTVQQLQAAGVALLIVEQSLNIAAELCPRAIFMEKGAVRFHGRTADLLDRDDIARAVFLGHA